MKQAFNQTQKHLMVPNLMVADTFMKRFRGLMGKTISQKDGLLIRPCNSVHMFWMKTPLDILFVDKDDRVVGVTLDLKPWKVSPVIKGAKYVIEALPGTFNHAHIGDIIRIEDTPHD